MPPTQIEMYRHKSSMLTQTVAVILAVSAALLCTHTATATGRTRSTTGLPAFFLLVELGDVLMLLRLVQGMPSHALLLG